MIASFCTCITGVSAEKTVTVSGHEQYDPSVSPKGKAAAAAAAADKKSGTSPECDAEPSDSGVGQSPSDALPDSASSPVPGNARVMVIVWRLRGNIIRTSPCWVV